MQRAIFSPCLQEMEWISMGVTIGFHGRLHFKMAYEAYGFIGFFKHGVIGNVRPSGSYDIGFGEANFVRVCP
jgi:hypothetical protein